MANYTRLYHYTVEVVDIQPGDMILWYPDPDGLEEPTHVRFVKRIEVDPDPNRDRVTIHFMEGEPYVTPLRAPVESKVGNAFAFWDVMRRDPKTYTD